ncbi:hypothetical protein SKAU_G00382600 [Synaphobranchus kaupii]|uniref:Uncharacterized protein n=1 Tax=Synaphobranchus kaupii TaxID=118154 RepID=A0A9Q1EDX4_SYNKA|nr:hypothetical protein SKAU_G00382600 [Synaphobranchus kaupii]
MLPSAGCGVPGGLHQQNQQGRTPARVARPGPLAGAVALSAERNPPSHGGPAITVGADAFVYRHIHYLLIAAPLSDDRSHQPTGTLILSAALSAAFTKYLLDIDHLFL